METINKEQSFIKAHKRVKQIKGFYTQLMISPFLITFWVVINLKEAPEFHWFWIAIVAWLVGLFIHWLIVFGLAKNNFRENWKQNKIKEIMNESNDLDFNYEESNYYEEMVYTQTKKRVRQIKSFYTLIVVFLVSAPIIIYVNLEFSPGFHFFWYAIVGMILTIFFHWIAVFGIEKIGFGNKWEQKKIQEIVNFNTTNI